MANSQELQDVREAILKLAKGGLQSVTIDGVGTFQSISLSELKSLEQSMASEEAEREYAQTAQIIFE